ncbi:MAG TPA: pyrimidine utilization protein A [Rhodopila sp.]|uniref:pyrimidine utilization protein A n=1 Tax=Rhodopila sp. TaxID=2480087 RepID=UPI002BBF3B3F|nr:pyrimidine utilization protein A [Rhodopila sp.]HVY14004.1 pyrimidine utilization protein A [Rhodopila sp.]
MVKLGVFIPIGSRGWLISTTSPKTTPSFDLNRTVVQQAEHYGFDFALSMIKLRGFGGPSGYWDENLESFTLMAGLASVTRRIKLFASVAVLTVPPAFAARMAVTIDSIAPGRFGMNIVSGWQPTEYKQMGIWPGERHFAKRYEYCSEYVTIMKELWETGRSDFKGEFFQMDDCRLAPRPSARIEIVGAAQSDRGMRFVAEHGDYCFCGGGGLNQPETSAHVAGRLAKIAEPAGRDVGALILLMIIADETDELAMAKWNRYKAGTDLEALEWQRTQASADTQASKESTVGQMIERQKAEPIPTGMLKLIGSYATVARMMDQVAATPGVKGILMTFDDFVIGMEQFGQYIQPLMKSRMA